MGVRQLRWVTGELCTKLLFFSKIGFPKTTALVLLHFEVQMTPPSWIGFCDALFCGKFALRQQRVFLSLYRLRRHARSCQSGPRLCCSHRAKDWTANCVFGFQVKYEDLGGLRLLDFCTIVFLVSQTAGWFLPFPFVVLCSNLISKSLKNLSCVEQFSFASDLRPRPHRTRSSAARKMENFPLFAQYCTGLLLQHVWTPSFATIVSIICTTSRRRNVALTRSVWMGRKMHCNERRILIVVVALRHSLKHSRAKHGWPRGLGADTRPCSVEVPVLNNGCIFAGCNSYSWGLSYKGYLWHNGQKTWFCEPFYCPDTVIGFHLNLYEGTLTVYKNGQCLGVAAKGLHLLSEQLFPAASSTSVDTEIELGARTCRHLTLQENCFVSIARCVKRKEVDSLPLPYVLKRHLMSMTWWRHVFCHFQYYFQPFSCT